MDSNKKEDRNEHSLIRMPKQSRDILGSDDSVELHNAETDAVASLGVFKAFSKDLKKAKALIDQGAITKKDLARLCFVSSRTYKKLTGKDSVMSEINLSTTFGKILIGTDPELLIMNAGQIVHANGIPGFSKNAKFGSDGAMAELRPDPATTPKGLVENMRKLFANEGTSAEGYDWVSSCYHETDQRDYPVGTHIHIGNPHKIATNMNNQGRNRLFAVTNKIMDELLAVPMIRLDGKSGYKRRARCKMSQQNGYGGNYGKGYGFFGEWRGKHGRLEHRTLSGLVISNPKLCKSVFGTALAIAEAVYKEAINQKLDSNIILPSQFNEKAIYSNSFKSWGDIPLAEIFGCVRSSKDMAETLDKSSRSDITSSHIESWLKKMSKLSTFGKYELDIVNLSEVLASSTNNLNKINRNIKKTWRS